MHWSSATGAACPKKKLSCKFIAFYVMIERRLIEMKISNATKFIEFIYNLGRSRLGLLQCTFAIHVGMAIQLVNIFHRIILIVIVCWPFDAIYAFIINKQKNRLNWTNFVYQLIDELQQSVECLRFFHFRLLLLLLFSFMNKNFPNNKSNFNLHSW